MIVAEQIEARRLVFVDEMGANTSLATLYAWSRRGKRARTKVPRNRGPNTTLLASMTHEGMGPCVAVVGSTSGQIFEAYIEQVLSTVLKPGQVVVMDNLSTHKGSKIRELIEAQGCELFILATLLTGPEPDRGSIRQSEALVRRAAARTREALVEVLGHALEAVTGRDARGFFEHCGYRVPGRPL